MRHIVAVGRPSDILTAQDLTHDGVRDAGCLGRERNYRARVVLDLGSEWDVESYSVKGTTTGNARFCRERSREAFPCDVVLILLLRAYKLRLDVL